MNTLKSFLSRFNIKMLLALAGLAVLMVFVPKHGDNARAEACANPPTVPTFNPYPVVFGDPGQSCVDFPLLRMKVNNGNYPQNESERAAGVTVEDGDMVTALVYFHNGAISNGDPSVTTARNVRVHTDFDPTEGTQANHFRLKVALKADNAATINQNGQIEVPNGGRLEIIPGSVTRYDFQGNVVQNGLSIDANGDIALGDLQACFEFSGFISFKFKVVGNQQTQLTCLPGPVTVDANVPKQFTFTTSDNSAGNWSVSGVSASPSSSSSATSSFTTTITSSSGSGQVTVTSNGHTASCPVTTNSGPGVGCIDVLKETYDINGNQLFPVTQFTFHLTNSGQVVRNDSNGHARFTNLAPGDYVVFEDIPAAWIKVSPDNGNISVSAGSTCSTITFKNRQQLNQSTLVCAPANQTVQEGTRQFTFTASGGNGQYNWTATNGDTGSGSSFTTAFSGTNGMTHTATVTSGGQSRTCSVHFQGNQQPSKSLSCDAALVSSTGTTVVARFTAQAQNISGPFLWTLSPDGVLSSNSGTSVTGTFTTAGQKTATVTAGGLTAQCHVNITIIPPPQVSLTCTGSPSVATVGQSVIFTAHAQNISGPFLWTVSPDGNLSASSGTSVSATFPTSGNKTATVSANGLSAQCNVQINPVVSNPVFCTPDFQPANVNQTVFLSAIGGNGQFTWSAPGSTNLTGSGSQFSTSYTTSGTRTVTVTSGNQTDTCTVQVNNQNTGSLNIDKLVRNQSRGGSFSPETRAEDGERVEYKVTVTANNGTVNNVQLAENLPNRLTLVNGSGRLDGQSISDNFVNNFISLGTMTSGTSSETRVLTFSAIAHAASGQSRTTIINTATVTGSNVGSLSDSATVIVDQFTTNGFGRLSIEKRVRNLTDDRSGSFRNSVNADNNDRVEFEIVIENTGSDTVEDVRLTDTVPSSLDVDTNSIDGDIDDDNSSGNRIDLDLGDLREGREFRITFEARVNSSSSRTIQNIARAAGDGVNRVEDDAFVFVGNDNGSNPNLVFSKRARNDTKNVDAMSVFASREDFITYTLTVTNTGSGRANNFVITDDLSGVLPFADMVDNGGGTLSGNIISFSGVDIPAGGSVSKSFRVRVKAFLSAQQTFVLSNTYGNTVTITVPPIPGVPRLIAPKTGAAGTTAVLFGGMLTAGFALARRGKSFWSFIWN